MLTKCPKTCDYCDKTNLSEESTVTPVPPKYSKPKPVSNENSMAPNSESHEEERRMPTTTTVLMPIVREPPRGTQLAIGLARLSCASRRLQKVLLGNVEKPS